MKMNEGRIEPVIIDSFEELADVCRSAGITGQRVMLAGDTNTIPLMGERAAAQLGKVFREVHMFTFEAGEENKTLSSVESLLSYLLDCGFDRHDTVAALGGGVTGDMAGFAAAVYLRGIRVIQIPTTLVAQIDSGIGGKTGVDFEGCKNMVGAFHMPALVCSCPEALLTLSDDQFRAGMGEVVKTALLGDGKLYEWLPVHAEQILNRDKDVLYEMIRRAAAVKCSVVRRDPTEQGERALLNLGHTIGHAVEKACQFRMLHGDCVGLGLLAAAQMSYLRGMIDSDTCIRIHDVCRLFGLPRFVTGITAEEILKNTKSDKKMIAGHIRFILIESPGKAVYADDVTDEELLAGIRHILDKDA